MAEVTDEELAKKRAANDKLRDQIASEEAKRYAREAAASNTITAAQLDAETARLEAELAYAKEASKVAVVKEGSSTILETAQEDQKAAEAQQAAVTSATTSTTHREA